MKKYLKVGEFAEICNSTRDTLLHYARLKILNPKYTGENGYRFYARERFWEYSLITFLKATGASLDEIRECLENGETGDLATFIKSRISALHAEQKDLARRIRLLCELIGITEEALHTRPNTFIVARERKRTFACYPVRDCDFMIHDKYMEEYSSRLGKFRITEKISLRHLALYLHGKARSGTNTGHAISLQITMAKAPKQALKPEITSPCFILAIAQATKKCFTIFWPILRRTSWPWKAIFMPGIS